VLSERFLDLALRRSGGSPFKISGHLLYDKPHESPEVVSTQVFLHGVHLAERAAHGEFDAVLWAIRDGTHKQLLWSGNRQRATQSGTQI